MDIGWAVSQMQMGQRVTRFGWHGAAQWIAIQHPDYHSMMSLSYIYICTSGGLFVPYTPNHLDLLANDWTTT